jgi:hypothetical protein
MRNDIEDINELFPAPAAGDLTADRHRLLKEHLMQEFTPAPRRARWKIATLIGASAVAATLALGATAVVLHNVRTNEVNVDLPSTPVGLFMNQVALAAETRQQPKIRPDQFIYVKSRNVSLTVQEQGGPGNEWLNPPVDRQVWLPQSGQNRMLVKENDVTETHGADVSNEAMFAGLPTDPKALLARAYRETDPAGDPGHDRDEDAFSWLFQRINETIPTPQMLAALYRAAALIPGVEKVDDSVDFVGRHGPALAFTSRQRGLRTEWIFDPKTHAFLGEREVMIVADQVFSAGTVVGHTAILTKAIVDHAGDVS